MAKKNMILEEKLEEAIVKDAPYEVPENWVWGNFEYIFDNVTSSSKKLKQKDYQTCSEYINIPVIDQGESFIGGYTDKVELAYSGKLPVIIFGDHSKCIKYVDFDFVQGADGVKVLLSREINTKYLYYMLMNLRLPDKGYSRYFKFLREKPMPIAPLKEQQRIVNTIENLFKKLDRSKELIEEAREGFEKRKTSILEKAFRGELTKKWREYRGIQSSDKLISLKEVANFKGGFAFKSTQFVEEGIQVIRMGNLYNGILDLERSPVFVPKDFDINLVNKYKIKKGDILLTLTGTKYKRDYGFAVLIDEDRDLLLNQRILSITPKESIVTKYLYYYLKSDTFKDIFFSQETGGVNQGNVSGKFVETIKIKNISIEEQKEIVKILDNLLEKESKIEKLTELEDQIELIKKSILAKAFRGELETNSEDEESALELFKKILSIEKSS
ncbi:restriction endonuclease subunit S [Clostridium lundense]|uniref:restriction endonuclease subunit S n=1 Tax=Clostridium lundense TaxID=319475 RepID=UPI000480C17C|nr:restriction endonuclease subunit S [Clostridium lundense]